MLNFHFLALDKKTPYHGIIAETADVRDYQLAAGVLNIPTPSSKFKDITYEQDEVSNCSCTLHGALGTLSDLLGIKFSLEERKELWRRAVEMGAQEGIGWYVDKAVKLVRDFAREKGYDILYFRVMLGSEEYADAIKKGYSVVTGYRGNATYNNDIDDGFLDGSDFTNTTYGHCLRLTEDMELRSNESLIDNYPISRPKSNIYRVTDSNLKKLRENSVFFNYGYLFVNRKDFEIVNPSNMDTVTETIVLLKSLWAKQSDEDKIKIGEVAAKLREVQKSLQIEVTK